MRGHRFDLLHAVELDVVTQPSTAATDGAEQTAVAADADVAATLEEGQRLEGVAPAAPVDVQFQQALGLRRQAGGAAGRGVDRLWSGETGGRADQDDAASEDGNRTSHP